MARKKTVNLYFDTEQEEAVVNYLNSDSVEEKEKIYNQYLQKPFIKMVESIIKRYKMMRPDIEINDLRDDVLSYLLTKLDKFKPDLNKKAYSYYGTVSRNYLKQELLKYSKNLSRYIEYDSMYEDDEKYGYDLDIEEKIETYDFIPMIINKIQDEIEENEDLRDEDKKVGYALIELLTNWETFIDSENNTNVLNRNKALYFIREYTLLDVKDVRIAMKKFKAMYSLFKKEHEDYLQ